MSRTLTPTHSQRPPYAGPHRKLVLAFDVGTTFSGISYSILDPGIAPEIKGVNRYPCQEIIGGSSKIPTVIYYDQNGTVKACGAETMTDAIQDRAETEGWVKAEWFKLHLRPNVKGTSEVDQAIPPLPLEKTAIDLLADFYRYLLQCAKTYIEDTHAAGAKIWESVQGKTDYVLSHPNGWEGAQQTRMRLAAIRAGLITSDAADLERVRFVTEGEASLHFCLINGLATESVNSKGGIVIVDAGGGTIDISSYARPETGDESPSMREATVPQCHLKGSIFVTQNARLFLTERLKDSRFIEDVDLIAQSFDRSTKLQFRSKDDPSFIQFGSPRDADLKVGLKSGRFQIPGQTMANFFKPSVDVVIESVEEQVETSQAPLSSVFLVGGFSASDWLFNQVKDGLKPLELQICRPDGHLNKAVSDGAISFYLDKAVTARVSKFSYGTDAAVPLDLTQLDHHIRLPLVGRGPDGTLFLSEFFSNILPKGTLVTDKEEFRKTFMGHHFGATPPKQLKAEIWRYEGVLKNPRWMDIDKENYKLIFTILCEVSSSANSPFKKLRSEVIGTYFEAEFDVVFLFGRTELQAQISWTESGVEKRSPAKIIYEAV